MLPSWQILFCGNLNLTCLKMSSRYSACWWKKLNWSESRSFHLRFGAVRLVQSLCAPTSRLKSIESLPFLLQQKAVTFNTFQHVRLLHRFFQRQMLNPSKKREPVGLARHKKACFFGWLKKGGHLYELFNIKKRGSSLQQETNIWPFTKLWALLGKNTPPTQKKKTTCDFLTDKQTYIHCKKQLLGSRTNFTPLMSKPRASKRTNGWEIPRPTTWLDVFETQTVNSGINYLLTGDRRILNHQQYDFQDLVVPYIRSL